MTLSLIAATLIVSNGVNGVMSPDASCVAFQRTEGIYVNLGLYYLSDGRIEWIENGAADRTCGAFPSWTADGSLIYSLGTRSHTAYENWYGGRQEGYVIRIWKDGVSRDVLTRARGYDCMPSLAPDGRTVYGVAGHDRGCGYIFRWTIEKGTELLGLAPEAKAPNGRIVAIYRPTAIAVSPDGTRLAVGGADEVAGVAVLELPKAD